MNNTIAWIMAAFVIATIITDLSVFILMKNNKRAYEQNGNNTRKTKAYWAYLVASRLAIVMTAVVGALIICSAFKVLSDLMIPKNAVIYIITACICVAIAVWTWRMTKSEIREAQNKYDADQDYETLPLETFVDPKDDITVNMISLWLLANVVANGAVIAFAVLFANVLSIKL